MEAIKKDMRSVNLIMEMILNRAEQKKRIYIADPKVL